ncbi:MAG: M20 aminoacylase family protein [Pseudomonadota bacterium]
MAIINRIAAYSDDMKTWRQHLHAHPELDFECHETAKFIIARLTEFGVDEIHDGIATSGIVALINGQGDGPTIGLRADMDALPIQEVRDLDYKSKTDGKMHACGHDGHMTMLLGAARYLAETRQFKGRVALIFQPAEEGGAGGKVMCEEGIMTRFDISQVYGIHNWPGLAEGRIATTPGPIMAAADHFSVTIKGLGGHGAMPHTTIDPIIIGSAILQGFQTIVSRNTNPLDAVVISTTQFHAGDAFNVVPEMAELHGSVRTFTKDVRTMVKTRMAEIVENTAKSYGATATLTYDDGYPPTVNDASAVAFATTVAAELLGETSVAADTAPSMASEDFSFMLQERKGAYLFLGIGESPSLHHPEYDFKDTVAPIGASFFAKLVETAQPL